MTKIKRGRKRKYIITLKEKEKYWGWDDRNCDSLLEAKVIKEDLVNRGYKGVIIK